MTGSERLDKFLDTDPEDLGCERAMEMLHVYADLLAADSDAAGRYPEVAAHLSACGPCADDLEALLRELRSYLSRNDK
jgi:hypothetical protein